MSPMERLAVIAEAVDAAIVAIDDEVGIMESADHRMAARLSVVHMLMMQIAGMIEDEMGIPGRLTLLKLYDEALEQFPEPEPPKAEAMPTRAVKPGPSPWGRVR